MTGSGTVVCFEGDHLTLLQRDKLEDYLEPVTMVDLYETIMQQRMLESPAEIALVRARAAVADIGGYSIREAIRFGTPRGYRDGAGAWNGDLDGADANHPRDGQPGAGGYREHDIFIISETGAENITGYPYGPGFNGLQRASGLSLIAVSEGPAPRAHRGIFGKRKGGRAIGIERRTPRTPEIAHGMMDAHGGGYWSNASRARKSIALSTACSSYGFPPSASTRISGPTSSSKTFRTSTKRTPPTRCTGRPRTEAFRTLPLIRAIRDRHRSTS